MSSHVGKSRDIIAIPGETLAGNRAFYGTPVVRAMNSSNLPKVENTRARFLRKRNSDPIAGWIVAERRLRVVLESDAEQRLHPGDELVGVINLHQWRLIMRSKVVHSIIVPGELPKSISVMDPVNTDIEKGDGRERFRIPTSNVRLVVGGRRISARLSDASVGGLGIWVPEALSSQDRILCHVNDGDQVFELQGIVKYTVAELDGYRHGLELEHHDRVSRSKWDRFIYERNRRE